MGKRSQRKGRSGEIELTRILNDSGIAAVPGKPCNLGTTPDVMGVPGIHCEVKRVERLNISEAMRQAVSDAEKFNDGLPTVFHRRNRQSWLVTMRLDDWIRLYRGKHEDIS